ncbi:MAG: LppP/LprE family lipoprotein [Leptolyngbyaceae cyanobacterium]
MKTVSLISGSMVLASLLLAPHTSAQTSQDGTWLDGDTNWNVAGAEIPQAPNSEFSNLPECEQTIRKSRLYEDALVEAAGWSLSGPAYIFGDTTVITGMADADGMCRPFSYQTFVFVDGEFAGTLSPNLMDSRTDGSLFDVNLYRDGAIDASFNRYSREDALCCASRESRVFYEVEMTSDGPVLMPGLPASTIDRPLPE